jgi:hypothetical protein
MDQMREFCEEQPAYLHAGNAKGLVEDFDCGSIYLCRSIEPLCMLWCIPGFLRNHWTHAFKVPTR